MLNIAYNLLAGGTCLEHLELLRNDEAYLDALGARRIPDPTTAGDFCRRFDAADIDRLQEIFNATRLKVWRQQPAAFFEEAIIDADGTMVETTGECKQGMDINYNGQWGYHPLVLSLANTGEPLYVVNRAGNRPSHEQAAGYFDRAIALCRRAGFRKILLRGDTDFTQTAHLDRWDDDGRAVHLRHRRHAEPLRTGGQSAAKRLENAASAAPKYEVQDRAAAAAGERQAADRRSARVRGHPPGEGVRGRVPLPAREVPQGLSRGGGVEGPGGLPGPEEALRRRALLLLHHQRLGEAGRGDRLRGQRPLQPGEPAGSNSRATCGR